MLDKYDFKKSNIIRQTIAAKLKILADQQCRKMN